MEGAGAAGQTSATPEPAGEVISQPASGEGSAFAGALFADEASYSEADLGKEEGGDPPKQEAAAETEEPSAGEKSATPGPKDGEGKDAAATDDTAKDGDGSDKKGFVPLSALHEERTRRQERDRTIAELKGTIDSLQQKISVFTAVDRTEGGEIKTPELPERLKDFKVLSAEEEEALIEDDPAEAVRYQVKLRSYEAHQQKVEKAEKARAEAERIKAQSTGQEKEIVEAANDRLTKVLPGFLESGNAKQVELVGFAKEIGFERRELFALTDPRTRVLLPGAKTPVLMGEAATDLILVLNNAKTRFDTLAKEVEARTRETVTKEILAKVRAGERIDAAPSIGDAPSSGNDKPAGAVKVRTEEDLARLSPSDRERYLKGEL